MRRLGSVRVRPVQQMESAECGVACLAMILDYYGCSRSLAEVRDVAKTSRDGNSALDLLSAAQAFGLDGEGLALGLDELADLDLPAILHWDLNHFVVIEALSSSGARIVDPATGRRTASATELDRSFSGVALALWPTPALERVPRASPSYARCVTALRGFGAPLTFVLLANGAERLFAVAVPAASQLLIDHVIQPERHAWLVPVLGVTAVASLAQLVLTRVHGLTLAELQARVSVRLTSELGEHLFRLPLPFVESRSHGDLIERVRTQTELQGLITSTVEGIFDLLFVCLLVLLMLAYDPFLGSIALVLAALRVLLVRVARSASEQRAAAELAASGREQATLAEATASAEMNAAFALAPTLNARFAARSGERAAASIAAERLQHGLGRALSLAGGAMQGVILWFGGNQVIAGEMSVGVFAGFIAIRALLEQPLESVVSLAEGWVRFRGALDRCDDILGVRPVETGALAPPHAAGRIQAEGVGFRYGSGGDWVFRDVSFTVEPGEHLVIVGPSGQGKSTLAKLLAGTLEPTEGRVLLDGVEIGHYDREVLARRLSAVLQEPLILEASVRDNIALRVPDATDAAIEQAARVACFDEVVARFPDGYEALIARQGQNLSGGERQRLALAQALLETPKVVIMDEATSALDLATERRVLAHLSALPATRISVAHRSAPVDHADKLVLVAEGRVAPVPRWRRSAEGTAGRHR